MSKPPRYWVRVGDRNVGPFTIDEVRRRTDVGPDTLLCPEGKKGGDDWRPLAEVPEFDSPAADAPMAPTPRPAAPAILSKVGPEPASVGGGSKVGGAAWTVGRAVLTGVFGFVLLIGSLLVINVANRGSAPNNHTIPTPPSSAIPTVEYANKWTSQAVECTDFRWGQHGDLYFKVRFKSVADNFTEGGTLRYEAYDAQGVVVFSGLVGNYSAGQNIKVYEETITIRQEKMDRITRLVFGL